MHPCALGAIASGPCDRTMCLRCIVDRYYIRYRSHKSRFGHISTLIEMCHGQAARRQRREQPCVWHDGTEISSGFQTKPWLVAMTACSTRYRPPADFFGYEVVEASQSWMTVSQHQGARGSHAAPPPLVATLRALLTDNADESRKSEHDSRRAITLA